MDVVSFGKGGKNGAKHGKKGKGDGKSGHERRSKPAPEPESKQDDGKGSQEGHMGQSRCPSPSTNRRRCLLCTAVRKAT